MRSANSRLLPILGLLIFSAGCGESGPPLLEGYGKVTLDGKPVPNASVTFTPQNKEGSPSYGTTDSEGKYHLRFSRDRDGVLAGKHNVTITSERMSAEDVPAGEQAPEFVAVPKKYGAPGELTADVSADQEEHNFDLASGK